MFKPSKGKIIGAYSSLLKRKPITIASDPVSLSKIRIVQGTEKPVTVNIEAAKKALAKASKIQESFSRNSERKEFLKVDTTESIT